MFGHDAFLGERHDLVLYVQYHVINVDRFPLYYSTPLLAVTNKTQNAIQLPQHAKYATVG